MTSQTRRLAVVAFGLLLGIGSTAFAQAPGGSDRGGRPSSEGDRGSRTGGGGTDFRQQMQDRMKETLAATEEEWHLLQPRIERVQTLQRNISVGRAGYSMLLGGGSRDAGGQAGSSGRDSGRSRFGGFSRGGTPGGAPGVTPGAPGGSTTSTPAPVEEKAKELQTSVENKDVSAKDLALKLAALREERAKAKAELERAQEDLRGLLTVRQEAVLILLGVLDP